MSSNGYRNIGGGMTEISGDDTETARINDEVARLNTELAAALKQLQNFKDQASQQARLAQLGQITATIAHEIRNPLGAVRTSLFLLERKLKDKGLGIESQMERINNSVLKCDVIITQLLDYARTKHLDCTPSDLDVWLTTVMEEEARRLPGHVNVEVVLGLTDQQIPFDPTRLQRALLNMINNAVEAMHNTKEPRLVISTFVEDENVCLMVTDNGPGVSEDVMTKIRQPLFTTKTSGTGLGVPAIEQIAVQHGGRLDIHSVAGHGAAFKLVLPRTAPVNDDEKVA
jgi:signal transduction histidine kinase